jgi:hypothetical protein
MSLEDEETIKYDWFFRVKDFAPVDQNLDLRKSLLANLNMLDDISSVNNYEPILPARYTRWMEWLDEQPSDGVPAWLEWMGVGAWIQPDLSMDQGRQITAVNPQSRYRWVGCPSYVSDPEEAWKLLTQRPHDLISGESLVERAVIETGDVKVCAAEGLKPATIRIIQETSQSAALEISTQDPGWLIQADTWYPGWVAFLDGQAVAIEHAEYIFRGIYVPVGDHQVTLEYKPTSFLTGLVCSLVMLGLLIGIRRIKK